VPVVTLSTSLSVLNDQPGLKFNIRDYIYKAAGMMFNDASRRLPFHADSGETQGARRPRRPLSELVYGWTIPLTRTALLEYLERAVQEFNAIETSPGITPG